MMPSYWLGCDWNEVLSELEDKGLSFSFKITKPHKRATGTGKLRVVRFRKNNDLYEFVLAQEKFSPEMTP